MPNTASLWDYYLANGTAIDINSIPSRILERVVLMPPTTLTARRIRRAFTSLIPRANHSPFATFASLARLSSSVLPSRLASRRPLILSPQAANFPSLLVAGDLSFDWTGGSPLNEGTLVTNFNPVGTPYDGLTDADTSDSYPGMMKGLVYCSGKLTVNNPCVLQGTLIVGGMADINANMTIGTYGGPATYPPPGFACGNVMRIIPRTLQRVSQ